MGPESRRSFPDLSAELAARASAFEFVQAARVAEDCAAGRGDAALRPVGHDDAPCDEAARFAVVPTFAFAASAVRAASQLPNGATLLQVDFIGLTGSSAALPQHYTELEIRRLQLKDRTFADFLDLLHHRTVSLFYRASCKYRLPLAHEHAWRWSNERDPFERVLAALVGRGTPPMSESRSVAERAWLSFAGHFARSPRSVVALESLLGDSLGLPVRVQQFVGRWVEIPAQARSALPSRARPGGLNNSLGRGLVLGQRAWNVSSRVRIKLGPMSRERFLDLRPDGASMARLRRLVGDYLDGAVDFDVALELAPGERIQTRLSVHGADEARLGWTSRLAARSPERAQTRVLFSLAARGH